MPSILDNSVLTYYPIMARGEPIRYFLEDNEVVYTDEGVGNFESEKTDLEKFPFNQMPKLTLSNGKIIVQSMAILHFAAVVLKKDGTGDLDEDLQVWQLDYAVEDAMTRYRQATYNPDHAVLLRAFASRYVTKTFTQFDYLLSKSKRAFFVYDYPSYPEYHLLYLVKCVLVLRPSVLDDYPHVTKWHNSMLSRPGIKAYLESDRPYPAKNGVTYADFPVC